MRKLLVWIVVIASAFVFGIGAATGASSLVRNVSAAPVDSRLGLQDSSILPQSAGLQSDLTKTIQIDQSAQADPTPQPTPFVPPANRWYDDCGWDSGNWSSAPNQGRNWGDTGPGMMGGWNSKGMGGYRSGMMGGWNGRGMGPGMMGGWNRGSTSLSGQRITLDQAVDFAKKYATSFGSNLAVSEIMEFTENFYAVVREADSSRGAFELLIDPYSGAVYPEMGPNMMWNFKYGHMGVGAGDNTLTLEQARQLAQQALDANIPGAQVEEDGISFYGHYTFDYKINDQIAGMLSVNGITGDVWPHTWHGQFISEKEVTK